MGVVITIIAVIFLVGYFMQKMSRAKLQVQGKDKCRYCRARLKKTQDRMGYATVCSKCGKSQTV